MTQHELKCWPEFFEAIWDGTKPFEVRKNDRNYQVGDRLVLRMWCPKKQDYLGGVVVRQVTYVLPGGQFGIDPEYAVLGITNKISGL